MRKIFLIILLAAMASLGGCKKDSELEPSRLMGDLHSGQSLQTVQRELGMVGGDWEVVEDQRSLSGSGQPPSRLYVISRRDFRQYGQPGELVLTFFNDELVSAQFYAADPVAFRGAVEREQEISLEPAGDAKIAPSTRVWAGKDQLGRNYIGWIDKQRQAMIDQWSSQRN